jgi:hypothetical protein
MSNLLMDGMRGDGLPTNRRWIENRREMRDARDADINKNLIIRIKIINFSSMTDNPTYQTTGKSVI